MWRNGERTAWRWRLSQHQRWRAARKAWRKHHRAANVPGARVKFASRAKTGIFNGLLDMGAVATTKAAGRAFADQATLRQRTHLTRNSGNIYGIGQHLCCCRVFAHRMPRMCVVAHLRPLAAHAAATRCFMRVRRWRAA